MTEIGNWHIHWLEAAGSLERWRERMILGIDSARSAISRLIPPPRLDILVQQQEGNVISEIGMVGRAYRKSLFALSVDPMNINFLTSLTDETLSRQVAHEVHHCLRMAGPGYGSTLGEALVSEGLAGQFVKELFGNSPEPWECAIDGEILHQSFPDDAVLASMAYDHNEWFYGTRNVHPRWLGYTLGYQIAGCWIDKAKPIDAPTWFNVSARDVLSAARVKFRSDAIMRSKPSERH